MIKNLYTKFKNLPDSMKSGVVYTFSSLMSKGVIFLTLPVFTRIMPTDEIGIVNLYSSWYGIISIFSTLSLTSGGYLLALKEYSNFKDEYDSSMVFATSITTFIVAICVVCFGSIFPDIIHLPVSLIILMFIGLLFNPALDFWISRQRYEYKYKNSAIVIFLSTIIASFISIYAVLFWNSSLFQTLAEKRLWANNIILYSVAGIFWVKALIKGKTLFNKKFWKFSIGLSLPLMGHCLSMQILNTSDRIMIANMVGDSEVGLYGTIFSLSTLILIVWNAINSSFIPYLFKNIENLEKGYQIRINSNIIISLFSMVTVLFSYLSPEIIKIIGSHEYYEARYLMPPIAVGVSLISISNMYSNVLIYVKQTKVIFYASSLAAISNIALNYLLIPKYGYQIAAYTTLVSHLLLVLIEGYVAVHVYKTYYNRPFIFDNFSFVMIFTLTLLISMCALLLYEYDMLRLSVVAVLIIVALVFSVCTYKKLSLSK